MSKKPLMSYVLPTYNRLEWVAESIQGILGQNERNIELIIVDDGSTDGTPEFLKSWLKDEERVKIIANRGNMGAGPSRNIGSDAANSEIIGVMDSDDIYPMDRTEKTLEWFKKNPKSELVNFPYATIGYFNQLIDKDDGTEFDHDRFKRSGEINYFSNPSVAYKKNSAAEIGGYPKETDTMTDDYQFLTNWVKAGKKVDFFGGHFLCYHRILPDSIMSKHRGFDPRWVNPK